jgi:hypothetical protein
MNQVIFFQHTSMLLQMAPHAAPPCLSLAETEDAVKYAQLARLAYTKSETKVGE